MITQLAYRNTTTDKEIPVSTTNPLPVTNNLWDLSPLDNKTFTVGTSQVQITAVTGTKKIMVKAVGDFSGGAILVIGKTGVTTATGFPLYNNVSGSNQNTREPLVIDTTTPEEYYLRCNFSADVRVLYLG